MGKRGRHAVICGLIAVGAAVGAGLSSQIRIFESLHLKTLDSHFALRGAQPVSGIVLLTADQKALETFTDLRLFWHLHYAKAIRAASDAGAKVIGLDLAFGVPVDKWEPDYDQKLAEAVTTAKCPVVVGYVPALNTNQQTAPVPVNMIAAATGMAAFANLTADPDDFIRRQELMEDPSKPTQARSLGMRVAELAAGREARWQNGVLDFNGPVPLNSGRAMTLNFAGGPDTFARVSLADFNAAAEAGNMAQLRKWVAGKVVLVGTDSVDDRFATPFYTLFSGPRWTTAGVEIHANTVRTLLERRFLQPVSQVWRWLALLYVASLVVAGAVRLHAGQSVAWFAACALLVAAGTHVLFRAGWILSTSELWMAALFGLVAATVYRFATAEETGALFRNAVSLFVGKEVTRTLDSTGLIALTGKRLVVTILFTDIRGFTAFSEKVCDEEGPETLVRLLNEYMGQMAGLIVAYGGHVNKFIGDGILAVFSDDDEGAKPGDHARRAVECATRMVQAPGQFQTGAGLHTGLVVVGNVGSADKMEYTVLGDTVNLASRLESLNKEQKTKLLMSETTREYMEKLGAGVATTQLGEVPVRGKAVPIAIYTVAALLPKDGGSKAEAVTHA
jgi:adenylate cyclase